MHSDALAILTPGVAPGAATLADASVCGGAQWLDERLYRTGQWWSNDDLVDLEETATNRVATSESETPQTRRQQPNQSLIRVSPHFSTQNGFHDTSFGLSGRGRLDIPLFREWLRLETGDLDDPDPTEIFDDEETDRRDIKQTAAAWTPWSSADLRLSWDHSPVVRPRGRVGLTRTDAATTTTLDQSLWWRSDEGFGTRSRIRWLSRLNDADRLHASAFVTWQEEDDGLGLELFQVLGWYRDLANYNRFGLRALARQTTHPSVEADTLYLRTYLRHRLNDRLYVHVEPGIGFRADMDFDPRLTLLVRFECFFGRINDDTLQYFYSRP